MTSKAEAFGTSSAFNTAAGRTRRSARAQLYDAATGKTHPDADNRLPVSVISHNPDNPRDHLRNLDDLVQSVTEVDVVNAIAVSTVEAYLADRADRAGELEPDTQYVVVDGHRRLEASRRAGRDTIKVIVDDNYVATDESLLEAAFVANYHRENMTELEEANALATLVQYYGSQTKAAQRLGMAQSTIASKLSFLKLTPVLQADLAEGRRKAEHVRNLGKKSPEEQIAQADARQEAAEQRRRAAKQSARTPEVPAPASKLRATEQAVPAAGEAAGGHTAVEHDAPSLEETASEARPASHGVPEPRLEVDPGDDQQDDPSDAAFKDGPIKLDWRNGRGSMDIAFDRWTRAVQRRPALARYFELVGGPERMAADLAAAIDREERAALIEALKKTL
ncbi:ParB family chromosome partitioning protein [Streptomyces sp. V4I23]|uniref:ParB/RepB/Spo0J family partition protein n=1 Tax=Streptomyces sp. V4I23 TaxID=3042282 RepID=UPI0027842DF6|nr:ParB/RepB/Spo0J family partition protein [Streptomyces sp. V4I23]MDQ1005991.1 ParB family chromosome partitioning protein [Streptomyces sp. V4I23]